MKLKEYKNHAGGPSTMVFFCPGCQCDHPFDLSRWTWNGSMDKPTFTPSLLVNGGAYRRQDHSLRCHSFVTDGMIQFLSDCEHELAGQTVEIPDMEA